MASPLPYKRLAKTYHPGIDLHYLRVCRALYSGGRRLKCDPLVMAHVFPQHMYEPDDVYQKRKHAAVYMNYSGSIIDTIVAELFAERIAMVGEPEPEPFWHEWFEDVSPPGGNVMSFSDLCKRQVLNALVCGRAWTLIDLPGNSMLQEEPKSRADEEAMGMTSVYAQPLDPECVLDWEEDSDGRLKWALVASTTAERTDLSRDRDQIVEDFWHYTDRNWTHYQLEYDSAKPPQDEQPVSAVAEGTHSFGRVPVIPLELNDGLWAMGKLENLAVAHFNKLSALCWAEDKSLMPQLAIYQSPEEMRPGDFKDPARQVFGVGRMVKLSQGDKMEYVGPSTAPFDSALKSLAVIKDEMYRVVHHMAMSVDNSAASMQRSAESKVVDRGDTTTVLKALAQAISEHARVLCQTATAGRMDKEIEWKATGMQDFEATPLAQLLNDAAILSTLDIPSPTFHRLANMRLVKTYLGEDATDEEIEAIRGELESNISAESFAQPAPGAVPEDEDEMEHTTGEGMKEETEDETDLPTKPTKKKPVPVAAHIRKPPKGKPSK